MLQLGGRKRKNWDAKVKMSLLELNESGEKNNQLNLKAASNYILYATFLMNYLYAIFLG